ncbi:hypothetical protein RUND412_008859 [Rhizina undulata]
MKFSTSTIIAAAAFLPAISAHLVMVEPKQWTVPVKTGATTETSDGPQNRLQADGSNFPCHGVAPEESVATYEPGSMQTLQLPGSATHSGGSGQMSITYETTPSASTKFRVMTSFEGDRPMKIDGNLTSDASHMPDPIKFKVPEGLPAGKAVVVWTWFNKSGNREMYMQCATVTIGGSETSEAAFKALPEMFRANSGNGCTVPENIDAIKFKNPGPFIVGSGTTAIDCDNTQAGSVKREVGNKIRPKGYNGPKSDEHKSSQSEEHMEPGSEGPKSNEDKHSGAQEHKGPEGHMGPHSEGHKGSGANNHNAPGTEGHMNSHSDEQKQPNSNEHMNRPNSNEHQRRASTEQASSGSTEENGSSSEADVDSEEQTGSGSNSDETNDSASSNENSTGAEGKTGSNLGESIGSGLNQLNVPASEGNMGSSSSKQKGSGSTGNQRKGHKNNKSSKSKKHSSKLHSKHSSSKGHIKSGSKKHGRRGSQ